MKVRLEEVERYERPMKNRLALTQPNCVAGALKRMHPAEPQMTADRSTISEWPEHRSLGRRTIVTEVRSGKRRSVLELGMSPHPMRRLERIIRPINGLCQRERRKPLLRVKSEKPRDLRRIEEELSDALTASVEIRVKKRTKRGEQGEVAIAFGSLDELNGLLERLGLSRN